MTQDKEEITEKVEFCSLVEKDSLSLFLSDDFKISKSLQKKFPEIKSYLKKKVRAQDLISLPVDLMNSNLISPVYQGEKVEIIFQNRNLIVLNKPPGHHGHPLVYSDRKNILSFIREIGIDRSIGLPSADRERGLLYRLDGVTSGVLVYLIEGDSKKQREQVTQKIYLAIVHGNLEVSGKVTQFFTPTGKKGMKVKVDLSHGEFKGVMFLRKIEFNQEQNLSLVEISLETGLRHQIRAGLSALGYPILGDELYGGEKSERVFLHAYKYSFLENEFLTKKAFLFDRFFDLNSIL